MNIFARCAAAAALLLPAAGCMQTAEYSAADSFGAYTQRTDKVTLSSGDAQEVNLRIHEIDPWPRHAGNTRIVTGGPRMANAVKRLRENQKPPEPLPTVGTTGGSSGGTSTGGN